SQSAARAGPPVRAPHRHPPRPASPGPPRRAPRGGGRRAAAAHRTAAAWQEAGRVSRVAVLKGGRSLERQVSLRSGAKVEDALERLGHDVIAIDVGGDLVDRLRAEKPDLAFVALHGRDGEDGTVQELLAVLGVPYTSSGITACIPCPDEVLAKHPVPYAALPT